MENPPQPLPLETAVNKICDPPTFKLKYYDFM
ncbi:BnaCnng45200D [Brassica napus]|uniref:BnaCnng45200D protein n=1 Tax=Brassica napus TaxID=3708 RepID=A0A078JGQ3_BRANA|nr:BnaCnng45200D [Brassica napus]